MFFFKNYFHLAVYVGTCVTWSSTFKNYKSESNLKCLPSLQGSIRESGNVHNNISHYKNDAYRRMTNEEEKVCWYCPTQKTWLVLRNGPD